MAVLREELEATKAVADELKVCRSQGHSQGLDQDLSQV